MTCSKKVKFIRIDGSTPAQTRGDLVNKFQQNSDVRVAILSINAAGTGLTLTVSRLLATVCSQTPDAQLWFKALFWVLQANNQAMYAAATAPLCTSSIGAKCIQRVLSFGQLSLAVIFAGSVDLQDDVSASQAILDGPAPCAKS